MREPPTFPSEFETVPVGEMAFALSYFVMEVNQQTGSQIVPILQTAKAPYPCEEVLDQLYELLALQPPPASVQQKRSDEASLPAALKALCRHYEHSAYLVSLCARVLAFYLLTERTAGKVLEGWSDVYPENERVVMLNSAVLDAMATVPLGPTLFLSESQFRNWLGSRVEPS